MVEAVLTVVDAGKGEVEGLVVEGVTGVEEEAETEVAGRGGFENSSMVVFSC